MAYAFGLTGELLYDADPNKTPVTEIENVKDVTLTLTSVDADTTSRNSSTFKSSKVVLLEASLSFEMIDDLLDGDGAISAIQTAFMAKAAISMHAKDNTSGEGVLGDWNITSFTRNEPLEGVSTYSVEAKPNNESREPSWSA